MLTPHSLAKIDEERTKYPVEKKRSVLMSALRIAQEEKGWLSTEMIAFVAEYLDLPAIAAYEVATFYNMYNLKPVGHYKLTVCTNLPCALSGAIDTAEYLQKKLGVGFGETTLDGRFTLQEGECMGACGYAPVVLINNHTMCRSMTAEAIDKKLAELE